MTLAYFHALVDAESIISGLVLLMNGLVSRQHIRSSWFPKGHSQIACFIKTDQNDFKKTTVNHHIWVAWTSKFDNVCLVNNLQINNKHFQINIPNSFIHSPQLSGSLALLLQLH